MWEDIAGCGAQVGEVARYLPQNGWLELSLRFESLAFVWDCPVDILEMLLVVENLEFSVAFGLGVSGFKFRRDSML